MGNCVSDPSKAKKDKGPRQNNNDKDDLDIADDQETYEQKEREWDKQFENWELSMGPRPGPHPGPNSIWNLDPHNYKHKASS